MPATRGRGDLDRAVLFDSVKDTDSRDAVWWTWAGASSSAKAVLDNQCSANAAVIHRAKLAVLAREDLLSLVERPDIALGMLTAMTRLRHHRPRAASRLRNANGEDATNLTMADGPPT